MPTLREKWNAALSAWRDPEVVRPALPEPDVGLPPHLVALPVYDHWHPSGRTLFGWLHVTRQGEQVVGFTPYACPAYGARMAAHGLRDVLKGGVQAAPVSTWRHAKTSGTYGLLGSATVQASSGPLEDGETVWLYDGDMGRLFIRRKGEFLDGRFQPVNGEALRVAASTGVGEVP